MSKSKWAMVLAAMLATGCGAASRPVPVPTRETSMPAHRRSTASTRGAPNAASAAPQMETRVLRAGVFDDTNEHPVTNALDEQGRIDSGAYGERVAVWVRGHGYWYPDLRYGGDVETLAEFVVGETHERDFCIYPDGTDGTEIYVPFTMTSDMISGSVRDSVQVSISDRSVRVTGPPITNCEQEFPRYRASPSGSGTGKSGR